MRLDPPLVWKQGVMRKLWEKHRVEPGEVEEVDFDDQPLFRKHGQIYHAYGKTTVGRHLFVVFRYLGEGKAKPITAYRRRPSRSACYRQTKGGA